MKKTYKTIIKFGNWVLDRWICLSPEGRQAVCMIGKAAPWLLGLLLKSGKTDANGLPNGLSQHSLSHKRLSAPITQGQRANLQAGSGFLYVMESLNK